MYTGLTQTKGTCPICGKEYPKGTLVWFDSKKSEGNNLVHKSCYDDLLASRGETPSVKSAGKTKSRVQLDPPF